MVAIRKKVHNAEGVDVGLMSEDPEPDVKGWITTGFPHLDAKLGGGWPLGRISENAGKYASGKSALADLALVKTTQAGGIGVVVEFEGTRDPARLQRMGANLDQIIFHQPDYAEEGWDMLFATLDELKKAKSKVPVFAVWDSVGHTLTKNLYEAKSAEDNAKVADLAGVMTRGVLKARKRVRDTNVHLQFINQVRDKFGGRSFFKEYETPGGHLLKHCFSIRLFSVAGRYPKQGPKTGLVSYVKVEKNKIVPPGQNTYWILDFYGGSGCPEGPSPELTAFDILLKSRYIKTSPLGAGQYTCPLKKVFKVPLWRQMMQEKEFSDKVWEQVLKTDTNATGAAGYITGGNDTGDEE